MISGDNAIAIGISEPDAGSAATDMVTRAEIKGDTVVVRGLKRWISNGGDADRYLVVPADAPVEQVHASVRARLEAQVPAPHVVRA